MSADRSDLTDVELDFLAFYRREKGSPPAQLTLEQISGLVTRFLGEKLLMFAKNNDVCLSVAGHEVVQRFRPRHRKNR